MFFSLLRKDLFKGRWSLRPIFFKLNHCHACRTRFAAFFALLSCCVSSLLAWRNRKRICRRTQDPKQTWSAKIYKVTHWNLQGWINFARNKHNTGRNQNRAKQASVDDLVQHRSVFGSIGVVFMSCKVNFHVVRSALEISMCLTSFGLVVCQLDTRRFLYGIGKERLMPKTFVTSSFKESADVQSW